MYAVYMAYVAVIFATNPVISCTIPPPIEPLATDSSGVPIIRNRPLDIIIPRVVDRALNPQAKMRRYTGFTRSEFDELATILSQGLPTIIRSARIRSWSDRIFLVLVFGEPS